MTEFLISSSGSFFLEERNAGSPLQGLLLDNFGGLSQYQCLTQWLAWSSVCYEIDSLATSHLFSFTLKEIHHFFRDLPGQRASTASTLILRRRRRRRTKT